MTDIPEDIRAAARDLRRVVHISSNPKSCDEAIARALLSEREATEARTIERCAKVAETMPLEILHFYPRPEVRPAIKTTDNFRRHRRRHPLPRKGIAPMYEYAISDGEGTLLGYGTALEVIANGFTTSINIRIGRVAFWRTLPSGTVIFAPCSEDCETGR